MTGVAKKIVDILLETGEPDQDYDHGPWDAIVRELENNGIHGATHREFDKYQGVYLNVPNVGKFWVNDEILYFRGGGFIMFLSPAYSEEKFEVAAHPGDNKWAAQIDELADYCKRVIAVKIQHQTARNAVDAVMAQSSPKKSVKGKAKADLGGSMAGAPGMMAMPSDI